MKKTRGFLLTASVCLAITFTFSCSGDDGDGDSGSSSSGGGNPSSSSGGSYLSCEELQRLTQTGFMGGDPGTYMDSLGNSCMTEYLSGPMECGDNKGCIRDKIFACMEKDADVKTLCGGGSEHCGEHYRNTCGSME